MGATGCGMPHGRWMETTLAAMEFSIVIPTSKCSKCGQPATHKFTRIQNGQIYDIYLCGQHAAEMSPYQKPQGNLSEILEGLLKHDLKIKVTTTSVSYPSGIRCKGCGLNYEAYRKNFMLGCSECYASFRELLVQDLRKIHGDVRHVGRRPGGGKVELPEDEMAMPVSPAPSATVASTAGSALSQQRRIEMLKELQTKLERAIRGEDFESAARYRDQIRELKERRQT
jgi:protein arginine kinase activator